MFGDFVYSFFILGGCLTFLDILGKVNTKEITSVDELKRDIMFKGLYMLKVYTNTTIVIENVIDKAKDCLDNKYNFSDTDSDSDDENNKCKLKLDLYNEDDMKIVKAVINYDIEDKYKITDSEITDLEGEELEKSSIIYAYDYFTKTYLLIENIDLDNLLQSTQTIIDEFENSQYDTKMFINIELSVGGEKHDLLKYIQKYFRSGNTILSKEFIEYIIEENDLTIHMEDDYIVNIMDKNIKMFTLDKNKSIEITLKEDDNNCSILEYKIINKKN